MQHSPPTSFSPDSTSLRISNDHVFDDDEETQDGFSRLLPRKMNTSFADNCRGTFIYLCQGCEEMSKKLTLIVDEGNQGSYQIPLCGLCFEMNKLISSKASAGNDASKPRNKLELWRAPTMTTKQLIFKPRGILVMQCSDCLQSQKKNDCVVKSGANYVCSLYSCRPCAEMNKICRFGA